MKSHTLLILLLLSYYISFSQEQYPYSENFENVDWQTIKPFRWTQQEEETDRIEEVTNYQNILNAGEFIRIQVHKYDTTIGFSNNNSTRTRAEITFAHEMHQNEHFYYSWRIFIPESLEDESILQGNNGGAHIIMQWHPPGNGWDFNLNQIDNSYTVTKDPTCHSLFHLKYVHDVSSIDNKRDASIFWRYDAIADSLQENPRNVSAVAEKVFVKGEWNFISQHMFFHPDPDSAYMEIWINGTKMSDSNGNSVFSGIHNLCEYDLNGNYYPYYMKFGHYITKNFEEPSHTIYMDDFSVAKTCTNLYKDLPEELLFNVTAGDIRDKYLIVAANTTVKDGFWEAKKEIRLKDGFRADSIFRATTTLVDFCSETTSPSARVDSDDQEKLILSDGMSSNHIYPVPTNRFLTIQTFENLNSYTVLTQNGKAILESEIPNSTEETIDLSDIPQGVYLLKLRFVDSTEQTYRFIKK